MVKAVSQYLNISPDEVLIRWGITRGFAVLIPPTFVTSELLNKKTIVDITIPLPKDVMKSLNNLHEGLRTTWESNDEEIEL